MRIIFMGTPDFAVGPLEFLLKAGHEILCVVTQPDKPKNRGKKVQPTPVKEAALKFGLEVVQPETIKGNQEFADYIKGLDADLAVVAAYGKILPKEILEAPKMGCVNIHASLLPAYRGSAPYQWAVLDGCKETGVSAQYMALKMDAGAVIDVAKTPIGENETAGELLDRLAVIGAQLLEKTLSRMEKGDVERTPQDSTKATQNAAGPIGMRADQA